MPLNKAEAPKLNNDLLNTPTSYFLDCKGSEAVIFPGKDAKDSSRRLPHVLDVDFQEVTFSFESISLKVPITAFSMHESGRGVVLSEEFLEIANTRDLFKLLTTEVDTSK